MPRGEAGVCDELVEPAEAGGDGIDERGRNTRLAEIAGQRQAFRAGRRARLCDVGEPRVCRIVRAARMQRQRDAGCREPPRERRADPRTCAGDQRDPCEVRGAWAHAATLSSSFTRSTLIVPTWNAASDSRCAMLTIAAFGSRSANR